MLCIGLFGTCGSSKWRKSFIREYQFRKIKFYNPQLDPGMWDPETSPKEEAEHLVNDVIILFPITSETYGIGSLAETGFSILQAIRLDDRRDFILLIDNFLDEGLKENEELYKQSLGARALIIQHLKKLRLSNVYLVHTFEEMLKLSVVLYQAAELRYEYNKYNPHRMA